MNWSFWKKKDAGALETFAAEMGSDFFGVVSPKALRAYFQGGAVDKGSRARIEAEIQALALRISQYKALHRVGIYGKARIHQLFMARLEELGYDAESVKALNQLLMVKSP